MPEPFDIGLDLSLCLVVGRQAQADKALRAVLTSIYQTADPVSFEVLVAEVGETGAAALVDDFPGLVVSRLAEGGSPVAAANHILRLGRGRYAALLEPGVIVRPGCLKRLLAVMDDNPEVGLAGPRLLDAYGATEVSVLRFPPLLGLSGLPLPGGRGRPPTASGEIDWQRGGFHLLRRELIEDIGLFDPACGRLAELDLYWRARRGGWHAHLVFEATAIHANPARYHRQLRPPTPWPLRLAEGLSFVKSRWREIPRYLFDKGGQ